VLKWSVNFYYGTDKMRKPQEFWKEEGKYWSKDVERFIGRPDAGVLKEIVSPSDSPDQKLHKIYAYVQKFKNLNYDQGDDSLRQLLASQTKEKRSVETVLLKKEGYRDEITRTFIALARAAGVQAYAMRVADRDRVFFQVNVPNRSQLTSELAIAVADGKEVFLDPGTPFCPYGLLPWRHTSTHGIRQLPSGATELTATPPASYKDAVSKRVARLALSPDGSAHGQIAIGWAGIEALEHRLNGFRTDEAGRKKELEDEARSMLPPGAIVEQLQATGWDTPGAQLSATFKVDVPSFASSTGKRLLVPSNLFESAQAQPFEHGERNQPVYFNYPYYAIDDVQISFPSGMTVENLPQAQPLKTDYSFYRVQRSANANSFSVTRDFAMGGIAFVQKDYPDLKKFFSGVFNDDSEQVVLTRAQ
jgi:transglutaminase superfamily protein